MGGGLMQLVAYGAQDIYLTGNPQITFFKVVYRRHTNFSMECIKQSFKGKLDSNSRVVATLARNGDLVHDCFLKIIDPDIGQPTAYAYRDYRSNIGHNIIDNIECEIGGQLIDKQYGHFMETYSQLNEDIIAGFQLNNGITISNDDRGGSLNIANFNTSDYGIDVRGTLGDADDNPLFRGSTAAGENGDEEHGERKRRDFLRLNNLNTFQIMSYSGSVQIINLQVVSGDDINTEAIDGLSRPKLGSNIYVPLRFWFCRNPGLALPLIALQYHEVNINLKLSEIYNSTAVDTKLTISNLELWCNYIYLDTDERRRFAQVSHEYLIEQLQLNTFNKSSTDTSVTVNLNFNHPVKELIWINLQSDTPWGAPKTGNGSDGSGILGNYGLSGGNKLIYDSNTTVELKLNGHDRFEKNDIDYFTRYQPYKHHNSAGGYNFHNNDIIAVYSFALKPNEHQPSGTCNFSRIDNSQLIFNNLTSYASGAGKIFHLYAINYNVLRIMSGMGGLAYSN